MKKVLSWILAAALVLSMTGCGLIAPQETTPSVIPEIFELLDLSAAEKVETLYFDYYVLNSATREQADSYAQAIADAGYEERTAGWINDAAEDHFAGYYSGGDRQVTLCFYKDTIVLCQNRMSPKQGDVWLLAGAPEALLEGQEISTEEDLIMLDTTAAQQEKIGSYDALVITNTSWQATSNYAFWLQCRKNFQYFSYFDNSSVPGKRFLEAYFHEENGEPMQTIVAWEDGTTVLITLSANDTFDEYTLWNWFGAAVLPGMAYLEQLWPSAGGLTIGSGQGFDSAGFYYSYRSGSKSQDFADLKNKIIGLGFVEEVTEVARDGYLEYTAARYDDFGGRKIAIWYQLILDGDYLEAEIGYSVQEGSHKN